MEIDRASLWLDAVPPRRAVVGYGELGRNGHLGYEGKRVTAGGRTWESALSTHPPSRLVFEFDGGYSSFHCHVAINDDVPAGISHADFSVLADGRRVAVASHVVAGEPPRALTAHVAGVRRLELRVDTTRWAYCHAVWLEPRLERDRVSAGSRTLIDCLGRAEILLPEARPRGERCIATVVSPGFEALLDDFLGSLQANGGCPDAVTVVFAVGESAEIERITEIYGAALIRCRARAQVNLTVKALLYSAARVIDAEKFLCLDADMLVLGDLGPLFSALDVCPEGAILACREKYGDFRTLAQVLSCGYMYAGRESDLQRLLGSHDGEGTYPLVVNDGLFAGSRSALFALDDRIRRMPEAQAWIDERRDIRIRNQFVFNLVLAHLKCGVELDSAYNVQLHAEDAEMRWEGGRMRAWQAGREARILHFNGWGRGKYPGFRALFAQVPDPLVETEKRAGSAYSDFLLVLRAWIGRFGLSAAAWSFYGTPDGRSARVRDATTFPLLALLHFLIRSNGCVRVLETGTARGVSAGCIASALAHREGGRLVTFDPAPVDPRRNELWAGLSREVRACIEPRAVDSLTGMAAALAAGERYEAALLDSLHTADHVRAEFELARQLVCPGGLILIHDPCLADGTVEQALEQIAAQGYGVTRLWVAEAGAQEDERLGLALIENRLRSCASAKPGED